MSMFHRNLCRLRTYLGQHDRHMLSNEKLTKRIKMSNNHILPQKHVAHLRKSLHVMTKFDQCWSTCVDDGPNIECGELLYGNLNVERYYMEILMWNATIWKSCRSRKKLFNAEACASSRYRRCRYRRERPECKCSM